MSKLGRYSADRKKIESVTATTKTVEVADCGTIFMMDAASSATPFTLPLASDAGKGWWCKFVVGVDHNDCDHVIQINSSDSDNVHVNQYSVLAQNEEAGVVGTNTATGSTSTAVKKLTLEGSQSEIGDQYEFITDGTLWLATAHTSGAAAFAMVSTQTTKLGLINTMPHTFLSMGFFVLNELFIRQTRRLKWVNAREGFTALSMLKNMLL